MSYLVGLFFLIPCFLIFKETAQAKVFVFFMIYSLSQFTFLLFTFIVRFVDPVIPGTLVLAGMIIELSLVPLVYRLARNPVRSIIEILDLHNPFFTFFPILSFMLFAVYTLDRSYKAADFAAVLLSTILIFFTYYLASRSISAAKRLNELELISVTDNLTGLFNRRYIESKIKQEYNLCLRTGESFALACIDIDYFKRINDLYGHDSGDSILVEVSRIFKESVRAYDTVARWGGEEFLLLFPETGEQQAIQLSERIRKKVQEELGAPGRQSEPVTITIGVSFFTPDDSIDMIIKKADMAMYCGKREGRNRVVSYSPLSG
jgi:diguanylate cyclase (GGDEF)-like protein